MSKRVWVLEDGDYSDYHVIGIYSTKARAEEAGNLIGITPNEWELDPHIDKINEGLKPFNLNMYRDGSSEGCKPHYGFPEARSSFTRLKASTWMNNPTKSRLYAVVWATNEQHAVKITNEQRIQLIANGEWPDD